MMRDEIRIYRHPNPLMRSFLTQEDISTPRVEVFKHPLREDRGAALHELGPIGGQVVKELMAIPGVSEIRIKPKEIRMKKEPDTPWEAIQEKAVTIMERALRRKRIRLVEGGGIKKPV
jgi:hypothetical protein